MTDKVKKAESVYKEWHQKDPRRVTKKKRNIPDTLFKIGKAKEILYESKKWEKKNFTYVHSPMTSTAFYEHCFEDDDKEVSTAKLMGGSLDSIPLTHLGEVLEFTVELNDGEEYSMPLHGKPMLCSTVDKKAIVILDSKGIIVCRGGTMRVDSRGIID
jgi:hypothetical protein